MRTPPSKEPGCASIPSIAQPLGRPIAIEDLNDRSLVWDPASRLVGVDDAGDALHSQLYGYDALDRLTEADIGAWLGGKTYGYDPVDNRTSLLDDTNGNGWGYAYGLTDNRQASRWTITGGLPGSPTASTYDAMGNLVNDGMGLSLSYDATGRLVQGTNGIAMQTSGYNALGQRMSRQVVGGPDSGVRLYAYDEETRAAGSHPCHLAVLVFDTTSGLMKVGVSQHPGNGFLTPGK